MNFSLSHMVLIGSAVVSLPMMLILFIMSKAYAQSVRGLSDWAYAILLMLFAVPLLIGRGIIHDFLSIIVSNTLIIAGFLLMLIGVQKLANVAILSRLSFIGSLVVTACLLSWFTFIHPDVATRMIIFSVISGAILAATFYIGGKALPNSHGKYILLTGISLNFISRGLRIYTVLSGIDSPTGPFDDSISQLTLLGIPALTIPLSTVACIMISADKIKSHIEKTNQIDELTQTLTKKAGLKELNREILRAKRHGTPLVTMFIDLDYFKEINDEHGHLKGDQVLIELATNASDCLRQTDLLFRYGGDEFVAILPETQIEQALLVGERIHEKAAESQPIKWTVSIGVSRLLEDDDDIEALLTRTDHALYQAKLSGRNKTMIHLD